MRTAQLELTLSQDINAEAGDYARLEVLIEGVAVPLPSFRGNDPDGARTLRYSLTKYVGQTIAIQLSLHIAGGVMDDCPSTGRGILVENLSVTGN